MSRGGRGTAGSVSPPSSRSQTRTAARLAKKNPFREASWHGFAAFFAIIAALWCVGGMIPPYQTPTLESSWPAWLDIDGTQSTWSTWSRPPRTLVTYIYSGTDGEYAENFRHFLREGIQPDDGCDYVLVIQAVETPATDAPTEELSRVQNYGNVRVIEHENACYDLGTLGWLYDKLEAEGVLHGYSHYVWINSSVRGPFLPTYLNSPRNQRRAYHWSRAFTDMIDDHVKLVGSTVSCGGSGPHPPTLHVQSYAVATDVIGLDLIRKNGTVLACYDTMQDVVFYGERGITETILNAGYGLDSLMARYQGMNWQKNLDIVENIGCNADMNPIQPGFYDGTDVDPMEVMFVKVKSAFLEALPPWPSAVRANRLSIWRMEQGDTIAASHNEIVPRLEALSEQYQRQRVSKLPCFDWEFYLRANKQDPLVDENIADEQERAAAAYEQFVTMGIFEGRPHRWTC